MLQEKLFLFKKPGHLQVFGVIFMLVLFFSLTSPVMAAVDLTGFKVDTESVDTLAGIVLVGLAGLWGVRKLIKTINRS